MHIKTDSRSICDIGCGHGRDGGLVEVLLHKVAQEANVNDYSVNDWLHEIEDVAYDAEDIFEECLLAESDADTSHCFCSYPQFLFRYRMGRRIKDVKDRIKSILEDATELKLFHDVSHQDQTDDHTRISAQRYREKSSILGNESQRVGIEEKIDMIIGWLNDPETRVIAVVGMGGLGKTFLLHHVFQRAKGSFSNSIWLSISQHYSVKELQCDRKFKTVKIFESLPHKHSSANQFSTRSQEAPIS
eukprot:Gb_25802 [translate_table: standard]